MDSFRTTRGYGNSAAFVPPFVPPQVGSSTNTGSGNNYQSSHTDDYPKAQVTEPQKYGETVLSNLVSAVGLNATVLQYPATVRVFLVVQNQDAVNDVWINFGNVAAINRGIKIAAGGSAFYDAFVPQDDLNLFCVAAANFALHYANKAL